MLIASKGTETLEVRVYGDSPERVVVKTKLKVNCIQVHERLLHWVYEGPDIELTVPDSVNYVSRAEIDNAKLMKSFSPVRVLPMYPCTRPVGSSSFKVLFPRILLSMRED
jgi:hypothetical protein